MGSVISNIEELIKADYDCRLLIATIEYLENKTVRISDAFTAGRIDSVLTHYGLPANAVRSFGFEIATIRCKELFDLKEFLGAKDPKVYVKEFDALISEAEFRAKLVRDLPDFDAKEISPTALESLRADYARAYHLRCSLAEKLGRFYLAKSKNPDYKIRTADGTFWKTNYIRGIAYDVPVGMKEMERVLRDWTNLISIDRTSTEDGHNTYIKLHGCVNSCFKAYETESTAINGLRYPLPDDWKRICQKNKLLQKYIRKLTNTTFC